MALLLRLTQKKLLLDELLLLCEQCRTALAELKDEDEEEVAALVVAVVGLVICNNQVEALLFDDAVDKSRAIVEAGDNILLKKEERKFAGFF